jgi:NAD(P)-dependent dehydrogenase (short-subunit alcohol dehydrogenase family)
MSELRFDGRVAVVTGAGRGLGRAYALLLASRGARVVVNDTGASLKGAGSDSDPAEQVAREIRQAGGEAVGCTDSVATAKGARSIIGSALDTYGRLDVLVHNAGIVRGAPLTEMTQEDFDAVLDVHLRGGFLLVRRAFPIMSKAGYGRVVLTASVNALYGNHRQANYAAAKGGLVGLSHVVALEGAASGVKSNVILPGAVTRMAEGLDTSAYPPMTPEQVAPLVGWLAHETCSVTGEILSSMAGRVSRAFVAESPGVYRPEWSMEQIAEDMPAIRRTEAPLVFSVVPSGQLDHIRRSFTMARGA